MRPRIPIRCTCAIDHPCSILASPPAWCCSTPVLSPSGSGRLSARDDQTCRFPHPVGHVCSGDCDVHHVQLRGCEKHQGISRGRRDRPTDLLLICENAHKEIHRDMVPRARKCRASASTATSCWTPASPTGCQPLTAPWSTSPESAPPVPARRLGQSQLPLAQNDLSPFVPHLGDSQAWSLGVA